MPRNARAQTGFTLLEVVIALTLSAFLLAILTAGMRAVVDQWQDSSNPFENELDTSLIFLQIERALLGAFPHSYVDQDTLERNVFFLGSSDSIAWVSTVSPRARQEVTAWQLMRGDQGGVLLKSTPAFTDDPTERLDSASGALILPDMRLTLSYLVLDDFNRPEWLEEWDGAEYQLLPLAVRLSFESSERPENGTEYLIPVLHRQHEEIQPVDIE